jgi:hypothetical protein
MVRICRGFIFILVAVVTFHPEWFKPQQGSRRMTIIAIGRDMGADKWKATLLMYACNVFHDPGFGRMASFTFEADSLFVYIRMACHALLLSLGEKQCFVAHSAVEHFVLPYQWKPCGVMVE